MLEIIQTALKQSQIALENLIANKSTQENLLATAALMVKSIKNGGKIISCGNGGSMCDAMHFAEEMTGRFRENRPGMAAIAISDPSHLSCVGNDYGYDAVFSRYIEAVGNKNDILLGISTSGKSANVIKAAEAARNKGMSVVTLTGIENCLLAKLSDIHICTPGPTKYADRVQELHIKCIHILIELCEKLNFG